MPDDIPGDLVVTHEQTEALFDLDQPPPIRKGATPYLAHLATLRYRDDIRPDSWTFWALAPVEKRWERPTPVTQTDHVWLLCRHDRQLYQALVDVSTGEILRRRHYEPTHDQQVRKVTA